MATDVTADRGHEIVGPRITVYNLMPYLVDPTMTEQAIAKLYGITPEQVAAARAYAFRHADQVLARHLQIEARNAAGNPPEVTERLEKSRGVFAAFRDWLDQLRRDEAEWAKADAASGLPRSIPTFKEWLAQQPDRART